jgi:uncharacterized membrane protein
MNPITWRREQQAALIIGAILGAVIFVVVGLMYRGLNYGSLSSQYLWSASTIRWAILGLLVGGAMVYLSKLLRS